MRNACFLFLLLATVAVGGVGFASDIKKEPNKIVLVSPAEDAVVFGVLVCGVDQQVLPCLTVGEGESHKAVTLLKNKGDPEKECWLANYNKLTEQKQIRPPGNSQIRKKSSIRGSPEESVHGFRED